MLFNKVVRKRQSVRSYLKKKVSDNLIKKILELANLSPSAGNLQARRVIVVQNEELRKKLIAVSSGFSRFSTEPPVIFVICSVPDESAAKYGSRGKNLYALQDATIFASYLQLAATSLSLASCWIGNFDEKKVLKILKLPKNFRPVAIIPVGYSQEEHREKSRKTIEDVIFSE